MNTKTLLVASLAGGLISTVLVNTPFVNLINLLVCAGFWIGPLAAVWLYRRLAGPLTLGQAATVGMLAGVWHGLLGLALSPLGLAGAGSLLNAAQPMLAGQDLSTVETVLTGAGGLLINLAGIVVDVVFGLIGGLAGGLIFGARRATAGSSADRPAVER
jgi:hypothetical protein